MKKTLSVFLAVLMTILCMVPAFATDGNEAQTPEAPGTGKKYSVSFVAPPADDAEYKDAYVYAVTVDGEIQYELDPTGEYIFFDNRYMLPSNVMPNYQDQIPEERYSPVEYEGVIEVEEGSTVAFKIVTTEKFNVHTAVVFINGMPASMNAKYEYAVYVDRDIVVDVIERDDDGVSPVLLRNHFNVQLTSGEGYSVKTRKGENYNVVYYGGSFDFRVYVANGYSASGIKVSVQRGNNDLSELFGEDFDALGDLMGTNEVLTAKGVDEDGCRLYTIENITKDCKIIVSGVREESSSGLLTMLKRVLRLILNLFGIELDLLDSLVAYYNVTIDTSEADGITYTVVRSSTDELSPTNFTVTNGEGVSIVVTKKSLDQVVDVVWNPGYPEDGYETTWVVDYNTMTGEVTYSAVYNIDNISADTVIAIKTE